MEARGVEMADRIVQVVAAAPRWSVVLVATEPPGLTLMPVAAWALVEREGGARQVLPMVVNGAGPALSVAGDDGRKVLGILDPGTDARIALGRWRATGDEPCVEPSPLALFDPDEI